MRRIPRSTSVLSRFRITAVAVIFGIGLAGALFYGVLSSRYTAAMLGRTLGPYSDSLAEYVLAHPDPASWRQVAVTHRVTILVEPPDGAAVAFDDRGQAVDPSGLTVNHVRAVRTAADGTRVTLVWTLGSFGGGHLPLLGGLLLMMTAVVGAAAWFMQRQLQPLSGLQRGVDAVARGDFGARVPVVRDDEIGRVAGAFNEMAGRVGEMVERRERLLGDVSHELRSPIARMKVALEFMPEGDKRDALARDLREMEQLIAALLEREALRSAGGHGEGEDVDLDAVAGDVVADFAGQGPGVRLVPGAATVHGDPSLIALLIRNLVDNAVKFSRPDSRPVVVTIEPRAEHVLVRVADDGIGIPDGSEERVFQPFVKLNPARGHRVGYGLGLDLCRRIAQLHGGTIRLLPREPRGTEAVATLARKASRVSE